MGKTARWFRGLLGGKKAGGPADSSDSKPPKAKEKKRWSFVRSLIEKDRAAPPPQAALHDARNGSYREQSAAPYADGAADPNKHAIAVAAATAAVAEAAVAAAHAAAAVVRLTSSSGRCAGAAYVSGRREESAAVTIQSAFRGYLARRALRALKGLVKLQALVRGHIVRQQTAEGLRHLQLLARLQARARAVRSHASFPSKGSQHSVGPATPEKQDRAYRSSSVKHDRSAILKRNTSKANGNDNVYIEGMQMNWLDHWMDEQSRDSQESPAKGRRANDDKGDKILEIDPGKPHFNSKRRNSSFQSSQSTLNCHSYTTLPDSPSKDSTIAQLSNPSPSSVEMQSLSPLRFPAEVDDMAFCTADNSPQFFSASSRPGSAKRGPFTPAKSDYSGSLLSRYSDYPNYMAYTESSRAKVRSQSAPRQRPEFEKSSSTKRFSVHGFGDGRVSTGIAQLAQKSSSLHAKFASKAYPGSGRLDKLGMPVR